MAEKIGRLKGKVPIRKCKIKYKVGYDALWYVSRIYALFIILGISSSHLFEIAKFIIAAVGTVGVLADIIMIGILGSRK